MLGFWCICWELYIVNTYIEFKFDVGYFQWYVSRAYWRCNFLTRSKMFRCCRFPKVDFCERALFKTPKGLLNPHKHWLAFCDLLMRGSNNEALFDQTGLIWAKESFDQWTGKVQGHYFDRNARFLNIIPLFAISSVVKFPNLNSK